MHWRSSADARSVADALRSRFFACLAFDRPGIRASNTNSEACRGRRVPTSRPLPIERKRPRDDRAFAMYRPFSTLISVKPAADRGSTGRA
jgi:hypothetical protein